MFFRCSFRGRYLATGLYMLQYCPYQKQLKIYFFANILCKHTESYSDCTISDDRMAVIMN
jgi:hypothetical protein